jgi:hypothetical protein
MPWKTTQRRATADRRRGKSASTQAGEFVKEQMHKEKRGKGRAKNPKQAIAIGLSEARRAGVKVPRKGASRSKPRGAGGTSAAKRARGAPRKRASR